jgi:glycosyltransferase
VVYGDLVYVDQEDIQKVRRVWKGLSYKRRRFRYGWMPAHPTFYFRKKLLDICGYYETHYFTAADYEFMARYLYRFKVSASYIPKLIVMMRRGGVSNGNIFRRLRANRRDYLAMKKNKIPFAFFVSFLKPLLKLHQYKRGRIEYKHLVNDLGRQIDQPSFQSNRRHVERRRVEV